jgi:hypothetical protein
MNSIFSNKSLLHSLEKDIFQACTRYFLMTSHSLLLLLLGTECLKLWNQESYCRNFSRNPLVLNFLKLPLHGRQAPTSCEGLVESASPHHCSLSNVPRMTSNRGLG